MEEIFTVHFQTFNYIGHFCETINLFFINPLVGSFYIFFNFRGICILVQSANLIIVNIDIFYL